MTVSIDDLLNALQNPDTPSSTNALENSSGTWSRIAKGDKFSELGLEGGDLDDFLREWIKDNPYSNI